MTTITAPLELHAGAALFQWHATSADTDGAFALAHVTAAPGGEPPLHVHAREDETFHVLSGTMTFQRGLERIEAVAGDTVHLPRGLQHGFAVTSPQARMLLFITPGGLEEAFRETSVVTDLRPGDDAPTPAGPPAPEEVERLMAAYAAHGVEVTGPPLGVLLAQGA